MGDLLRDPILQGLAAAVAIAAAAFAIVFFIFKGSKESLGAWLHAHLRQIAGLAVAAAFLVWLGYGLGRATDVYNTPAESTNTLAGHVPAETPTPPLGSPAAGQQVAEIVTVEVTRLVTSIATQLVTVIVTPQPPPPTNTPSVILPFSDDFNSGLAAAWRVQTGNPLIVNDMLTTDQTTWLSAGDASWSDYSVEFEVVNTATCPLIEDNLNLIGVRMIDPGNGLMFGWTGCRSKWYVAEDGKLSEVPGTNDEDDVKDSAKVRVEVVGDKVASYVGVRRTATFRWGTNASGGIALELQPTTFIDNFLVTSLAGE